MDKVEELVLESERPILAHSRSLTSSLRALGCVFSRSECRSHHHDMGHDRANNTSKSVEGNPTRDPSDPWLQGSAFRILPFPGGCGICPGMATGMTIMEAHLTLCEERENDDLVNHIGGVFRYFIVDVVDPGSTPDVAVQP
ncbi:hypothetical protein F2Q68_00011576 [Brassica cretica]|uniref:Uncharacterized protein n=1 Tax=Brassica cretica TaxID=69181 RepID=A0A8S9KYB6_BRACR|nr:hypothetical protein F2Q68_00011576 [Brassica cretica]